jgi:LPXTG-motif cell wall-anchored protein
MKNLSDLRIPSALFAVALAASFLAPGANADEWNKRTILTVNEPIQVQDAVLQPGQYVMKLLNSNSDRHIVQIFNGRENHVIATILAIPTQRLEPTGRTLFTFWETPAGTARAMRDWYYPGDLIGQEFARPKHPYELAMATAPAPPPATPAPAPEVTPAPTTPETQPENNTAEVAPAPEPVPQPAPPPAAEQQPAPSPAPAPAPAPAELPKTGSPYPAFGLAGVVLLAFGGLLRLRRFA